MKENGAIFDKVDYPAVFTNGVQGAILKDEVAKNEAFLYIPT